MHRKLLDVSLGVWDPNGASAIEGGPGCGRFDLKRFLFRNPRVLFDLLVTASTCLFHIRSDAIVTPRYLAKSADFNTLPWRTQSRCTKARFRTTRVLHTCLNGTPSSLHQYFNKKTSIRNPRVTVFLPLSISRNKETTNLVEQTQS